MDPWLPPKVHLSFWGHRMVSDVLVHLVAVESSPARAREAVARGARPDGADPRENVYWEGQFPEVRGGDVVVTWYWEGQFPEVRACVETRERESCVDGSSSVVCGFMAVVVVVAHRRGWGLLSRHVPGRGSSPNCVERELC